MHLKIILLLLYMTSPAPGQAVSLESLKDIRTTEGSKLDLEKLKKGTTIVNFWASWCAPCIQETPSLFKLLTANKDKVSLVSISVDDSLKDLKKFLRLYPLSQGPNIYIYFDESRALTKAFNVAKFPETFVFAPNGKLLRQISGAIDWSSVEKTLLSSPIGK